MDENPWVVDSIKDFWFLNCPECDFKAKEDDSFLDHANEEHPLSWILLEKSLEIDKFNVDSSTKVTEKEIKREAAEFELVEQNASHLSVKEEYFESTSELDETSVRISSQFNASVEDTGNLDIQSNTILISSVSNNKWTQNNMINNFEDVQNSMLKKAVPSSIEKKPITKRLKPGFRKSIKCDFCPNIFPGKSKLTMHVNEVHLKLKPNLCSECGASFSRPRTLRLHIKSVHDIQNGKKKRPEMPSKRPVICDICGNSFKGKTKLKMHVNEVHLKLKPNLCSECGAGFGRPWILKEHIKRVHLNIRPFKCESCEDRFFPDQYKLQHHVQMVHGEKTHKCTLCSDKFPTSQQLKSHIANRHDTSRPFCCSKCSKTFNSKELLEHHIARAHEMRNCEKCPHCNKQFSRIKAHLQTCSAIWSHTERRKFECPKCDKIYLDKSSLNKHMKISCNTSDLLVD